MDQYNFRSVWSQDGLDQHFCPVRPRSDQSIKNPVEQQQPSFVSCPRPKSYDYTLKFLLVGDSDVGKEEILSGLTEEEDEVDTQMDAVFAASSPAVNYKSTVILLDGKRIRLQLWDTSGQGRFSTIIRSYSRGAQGILLVYDITNKWSFNGLDRWLNEVEELSPGVPKILLGNRLHLAFKRQISETTAVTYARKHNMSFFEVSPLCNFNVEESFTELARIVLQRYGMESLWKNSIVLPLKELCCRAIVAQTTSYGIERLPLPSSLKSNLKSYSTVGNMSSNPLHPSHRIFNSPQLSASNLHQHPHLPHLKHLKHSDKDNTLKRRAMSLFVCDAESSSSNFNHHPPSSTCRSKDRSSSGSSRSHQHLPLPNLSNLLPSRNGTETSTAHSSSSVPSSRIRRINTARDPRNKTACLIS